MTGINVNATTTGGTVNVSETTVDVFVNGAGVNLAGATDTPLADAASAVVGTSGTAARADHVHPWPSSPTFSGTTTIVTADISGGNIDGTIIGATSAAAVSATTVSASGVISTTDATDSTSDTTGALVVSGGIGVGGSSVFDGTVSFQGGGGDSDSTIIGLENTVGSYNKIIVIGDKNEVEGFESIIIGFDNFEDNNSDDNIIIGHDHDVEGNADECILIGNNGDARYGARNAIVIGSDAAVGNSAGNSVDDGDNSIAIGSQAKAEIRNTIAMGYFSNVDGGVHSSGEDTEYGIAIGAFSSVDDRGYAGIAIGYQSEADGYQSIAIGRSAEIDTYHDASIAIGAYARSRRANQLVFSSEFETDLDETIREVAFNDPENNPLGVRWPNPHYFEGSSFNLGRERLPVDANFSSDGATVTVTSTGHGLTTGDVIDVTTSENRDSVENGEKTITVTGANTFTFAESGDADADGLIYLPPRQTEFTYDGATGVATFANTADATSTTDAPVVLSGGLGVAKKVHIGDLLSLGRTLPDEGGQLVLEPGSSYTTAWKIDHYQDSLRCFVEGQTFGQFIGKTLSGRFDILYTTDSTSTTTGALTVAGGGAFGGNVFAGGVLSVAADTNTAHKLGRGFFGHATGGASDVLYMGHIDQESTTGYSLSQNASGSTAINSASAQETFFAIGGTAVAKHSAKVWELTSVALKLNNAAVAATPTPTHTITIQDSTGTTYRVPCVV